ncbi:unnamed protein product [Scytosiphon promiscuus]
MTTVTAPVTADAFSSEEEIEAPVDAAPLLSSSTKSPDRMARDIICERDLYASPVWVFGGAIALLSAGTMQSGRKRRYDRRLEEQEREHELIFHDLQCGPDLSADGFSARNAFFFSHLSSTMYLNPGAVEAHFKTLGLTEFSWFTPPDEVARSPFSEINDTQAAVAATAEYIAVVFRGTQEGADWWTNLKFLHREFPELGKVHEGFSEGLDTVWYGEGMLDELRKMHAQSPRPIYVTGHSLGAALATIAAARITVEHDLPLAALYTVGSPRCAVRIFPGRLHVYRQTTSCSSTVRLCVSRVFFSPLARCPASDAHKHKEAHAIERTRSSRELPRAPQSFRQEGGLSLRLLGEPRLVSVRKVLQGGQQQRHRHRRAPRGRRLPSRRQEDLHKQQGEDRDGSVLGRLARNMGGGHPGSLP